jgi:hypothetical protein
MPFKEDLTEIKLESYESNYALASADLNLADVFQVGWYVIVVTLNKILKLFVSVYGSLACLWIEQVIICCLGHVQVLDSLCKENVFCKWFVQVKYKVECYFNQATVVTKGIQEAVHFSLKLKLGMAQSQLEGEQLW